MREQAANTIRSWFRIQIAEPYTLPTQYDNHTIDSSEGLWCRLTIQFGQTIQKSLGDVTARRFRTVGEMIAQLFALIGQGDGQLLSLGDLISTQLCGITIGAVHFRCPQARCRGRVGRHWQVNVHCPFYVDDIG